MKKRFIEKSMQLIKNKNQYDEIKLQEIKYGLSTLYITVTRTMLYIIINIFLNTFINLLLVLLFYIPIRASSSGFHSKTSLGCIVISSFAFIGIPLCSKYIIFDINLLNIFFTIFFLVFAKYSPADTEKKPILNPKLRLRLKYQSIFFLLIYYLISLYLPEVRSLIILTIIYQSILISPLMYKIFNANYNNYKNLYKLNLYKFKRQKEGEV